MPLFECQKCRCIENTDSSVPWKLSPLHEWSIIGMNHYHVNGERFLFVAMTRGNRYITEEGKDDQYLWNRLWHKASHEDRV